MARIPVEELTRIKQDVAVQTLVETSGVVLKRAGKDLIGRCPFHEDDTASLVITPAKNLWHCFGCGIGGGPIDWVMKRQNISFRHAVEVLRAGTPIPADAKRTSLLAAPVALEAGDHEVLAQVIDYYHQTLLDSSEALSYLSKRGLGDREMIERFKLGYANRTLGLRLPQKSNAHGAKLRAQLMRVGLYRDSGREHFNGSLVVPVFDEAGNVVEIYGRKLLDKLRAGTPKHLYLPTREGRGRGVWNLGGLQDQQEIILCEALLDALTFWRAGFFNVTAAYGTEGFTEEHLAALTRTDVRRVLIAFDRDEAGERAADKVATRLMGQGIECLRVQFPKGMDANEYARRVTPATKSLALVVHKAIWMGKHIPSKHSPTVAAITETTEAAVSDLVAAPPPTETVAETTETAVSDSTAVPSPAEAAVKPQERDETSLAAKKVDTDTPIPVPVPTEGKPVLVNDDEVLFHFGNRRYRLRGLIKNLSRETMKLNALVSCEGAYYVDSFDLYAARQRHQYVQQTARELGVGDDVIKIDLGKILLQLETLQEEKIRTKLEVEETAPVIGDEEREEALALLRSPDLLARIATDFEAVGLVGERTNKLIGYLAAVSRKLDAPLAVVVQSSSAAGKSSLMDAVLAFMPEEERLKYSAITGQSLFYMGETNLKHKILALCEEEGASRASYALKLLQSDGELTIASTGKDPASGNLITQHYRVEGPVMIFLTTTAIEVDEELMNRCLVLTVDEGREQTEAIHRLQRQKRTLAGLMARQDKTHLLDVHRNAQRLLRPLAVVNPYADQLTFLSDKTRTRRDHEKYLTLIDTIALLHQYQRPIQTLTNAGREIEYIEVTLADIAAANTLAHEALGRSLDELPPQTRRMLLLIQNMVGTMTQNGLPVADIRFSRRDVRDHSGWSDFQVKDHMRKLTELEYLLPHRGGRGQSFEYELLYDGDGGDQSHLFGLLDVATLDYDGEKEHPKTDKELPENPKEDSSSPQGATKETTGSNNKTSPQPPDAVDSEQNTVLPLKKALLRQNGANQSYVEVRP